MLIERQLAPALIIIGGTLVLPSILGALNENTVHVSTGIIIAGNLLGGVGLSLEGILVLDSEYGKLFKILAMIVLGLCAIFFSGGTALVAFQVGGIRTIYFGLAALVSLVGFLAGVLVGLKE